MVCRPKSKRSVDYIEIETKHLHANCVLQIQVYKIYEIRTEYIVSNKSLEKQGLSTIGLL